MKKLILLLVAVIFLNSLSFSQTNINYFNRALKESERLKFKDHKIRGFIEYTYNYTNGKKNDTVKHYTVYQLDTCGNLMSIADFEGSRTFETQTKFLYNENNNRIARFFIEEGKLKYKTFYYYDLKGELIEAVTMNDFGSVHEKQLFYRNTRGLITHIKTTGPSGTVTGDAKINYNSQGLPVNCNVYKDNKLISSEKFNYADNQLTEEIITAEKVKFSYKKEFLYKEEFIDSMLFKGANNSEKIINRQYLSFGQTTRNIEKWLVMPDFNKFFKLDNNYTEKFEYKTPPEFPGGKNALLAYIDEHLKYPKKSLKSGIEGLVIVGFVIDASGAVGNIRVHKSLDYELDNAAIDLVKKMPKWKPALNVGGRETMSSYVLPLNFIIN